MVTCARSLFSLSAALEADTSDLARQRTGRGVPFGAWQEVSLEKKEKWLGRLIAHSFYVDLDQVRTSGGGLKDRLVIRHPSAVSVIALAEPGEALVVRQHRYAIDQVTLEFPAGKLREGEEPEAAARRELLEETGFEAAEWTKLLSFAPADGYSDEIIHVFVARRLTRSAGEVEADEILSVETLPLARLKVLAREGKILDGTTIVSLAAYDWIEGIA